MFPPLDNAVSTITPRCAHNHTSHRLYSLHVLNHLSFRAIGNGRYTLCSQRRSVSVRLKNGERFTSSGNIFQTAALSTTCLIQKRSWYDSVVGSLSRSNIYWHIGVTINEDLRFSIKRVFCSFKLNQFAREQCYTRKIEFSSF